MRRAALYAASCWLIACGGSHQVPEDASADAPSPMADAEPDATLSFDAGPDAEPDTGLDDGGLDADAAFDADAPDALVCPAECMPSSECMDAFCSAGECTEEPLPDATECGELVGGLATGLCLAGTCVSRGCGDGLREGGAAAFREGCDDGNTIDGDGCSALCEPEVTIDDVDPEGFYTALASPQHPAMAADGAGRLLLVWERSGELDGMHASIVARRFTPAGGPIAGAEAEVLLLDDTISTPSSADPVVAGLADGGWVVTWSAKRVDFSTEVVARHVLPDGTFGREVVVNTDTSGSQNEPRVASLGDGVIVVWHDSFARLGDPDEGVVAQRLDATLGRVGEPIRVATDRSRREVRPAVATDGEAWLVLWQSAPPPGEPLLYGRRFQGGMPVDAEQFLVSPGNNNRPVATSLGGGVWALAWHAFPPGDVQTRLLGPGAPSETAATVTTFAGGAEIEQLPSIAPLPGGEYLVSWHTGTGGRAGDFDTTAGASLPPEAAALRFRLGAIERDLSVTPVADGTWFVWSALTDPWLGIHRYFLPHD